MRVLVASMGLFCGALLSQPALAATAIDLSGSTNISLNSIYVGGTFYPSAGATVTVGGVSFKLSSYSAGQDTGTVQTSFGRPLTINVPLGNLPGIRTVYTLANTAGYGTTGTSNFTFNFLSGASYVYNLVQGSNIRDHHSGSGETPPPLAFGTVNYGPLDVVHFDAQKIVLPVSFASDTLQSVTINDLNGSGSAHPFLAALSVAAVPEPATWAMMILGFGVVGGTMRRRAAKVAYRIA